MGPRVAWQAAACPVSSAAQESLPWQGARGGSACSARPPALPAPRPSTPSQPGGLGGVGGGPCPWIPAGCRGSWVVLAHFCLPLACVSPLRSAGTWGAPSSPDGVPCSLSVGLHTRAPHACSECVWSPTQAQAQAQTSSLRNGHVPGSVPVCPCARKSGMAGTSTEVCPLNTRAHTHVCRRARTLVHIHIRCPRTHGHFIHIHAASCSQRCPFHVLLSIQDGHPTQVCTESQAHTHTHTEAHARSTYDTHKMHQRCTCI